MVDTSVEIHNGCSFKTLLITTDHVGHRLGEFFNTRTSPVFKTKKKELLNESKKNRYKSTLGF
jgi:ribosomal protein S19